MKAKSLRLLAASSVILLFGAGLVLASNDRASRRQAEFEIASPRDGAETFGTRVGTDASSGGQTPTIDSQSGAGVGVATTGHHHEAETTATQPTNNTATPQSTTSTVPTADVATAQGPTTTVARIGQVLAGDVSFTNPVVDTGETLTFDPASSTTLLVTGNMTVLGNLVMHPNPDVVHRINFLDRGELIVTRSGVLDIQGTPKVAWNRTGSDPSWRGSDELIVAPIAPGDYQYHPFSLGSAVPTYAGYAAEVANLTRNVIIDNPSRVMLHELDGHAPQVIKYATISNAGVRDKLGFYALHFHLNGNATRGSIVEGVVIRDSQFRAFVPHGSHGITFRDTLAVNVVANGYWWDLNRAEGGSINESHGTVYQRAGVIGLTASDPPDQGRQSGFNLGDGGGNTVIDSFVAGVNSGSHTSGFLWPSNAHSVWNAQNLVSHNNKGHGFFVWQNDAEPHVITNIDSYLNAGAGINQGAYSNSYHWVEANLVANSEGIRLNTKSKPAPLPRQTFQCVVIEDTPVGVVVDFSPNDEGTSTLFERVVIRNVGAEFEVTQAARDAGQTLDARTELVNYQVSC